MEKNIWIIFCVKTTGILGFLRIVVDSGATQLADTRKQKFLKKCGHGC